ncbi:MAG: hypothetical protein NUV51_03575 [Sulfuricaulis sp.]|nr:hypothetical protein [Sulfuricaulis sp.]
MSEIKEGDLVQVVRWPCCGVGLGGVFRVVEILSPNAGHCKCGAPQPFEAHPVGAGIPSKRWGAPISWLKRIPPLAELDDVQTKEEIEI